MNEKITEIKIEFFNKHNWRCERCGQPAQDLAHRIAKTEANKRMIYNYCLTRHSVKLKKCEIEKVIHHKFNLACSCKQCNDYFNIGNRPMRVKELLTIILKDLRYVM